MIGAVLVPNLNQPELQETWGKTHWRFAESAALAVVFRPPDSVTKAALRVTHMATTDSRGRGGKTFIRIQINDKPLVQAYAPPQEKDNALKRPETFDVERSFCVQAGQTSSRSRVIRCNKVSWSTGWSHSNW